MKNLLFGASLLVVTAMAHASDSRMDSAVEMGQKLGSLPTTLQVCGKSTPQQQAELKQVLGQLEAHFSAVQGPEFVENYRKGFRQSEATAQQGAAQFKNGLPKQLAASCDAFNAQYPTMLEGLRRLAKPR